MSTLIPEDFRPAWWARGKHRPTVLGHLTNRAKEPECQRRHNIDLEDGDRLVAVESRPKAPAEVAAIALLMHGLGGDAQSRYMLSAALRFVQQGWAVFRLNHRGAGQGAGLAQRLYNCGLSDDVHAALKSISRLHPDRPVVAVGYSMSGNTLLKYLGERGDRAFALICGAVAVNPPIAVGASIDALATRQNRLPCTSPAAAVTWAI